MLWTVRWCRAAVLSLWSSVCRKARLCLGTEGGGLAVPGPSPLPALPLPPGSVLPYFWQVGQAHSGSMGRKSFSYCFFFSCRFPVGTRAEPKRWGWTGGGEGGSTRSSPRLGPRNPPPVFPLPRASPLSVWGRRSQTCRIREPRRPPDQWHSWGWGRGGGEQRTSSPGHIPRAPLPKTGTLRTTPSRGPCPPQFPPKQGCVLPPPRPPEAGFPRHPLPAGGAVSPLLHIPDPHQVSGLVLRQP